MPLYRFTPNTLTPLKVFELRASGAEILRDADDGILAVRMSADALGAFLALYEGMKPHIREVSEVIIPRGGWVEPPG
jgi:hypothetical protein